MTESCPLSGCPLSGSPTVRQINREVDTFRFYELTTRCILHLKHLRHTWQLCQSIPMWRDISWMSHEPMVLPLNEAWGYYGNVCITLFTGWARLLMGSGANRCRFDRVISGWGDSRSCLCGKGEDVLANRLVVVMQMTHTFAGRLPNSSWIKHIHWCSSQLWYELCEICQTN